MHFYIGAGQRKGYVDAEGRTCMHLAVLAGSVDLVTEFLQRGADPNLPSTCSQRAAIMDAASKGYTEILSLLLQSGAKVNQVDVDNDHALIFAARRNQLERLKMLIQYGVEVNLIGRTGRNALMNATLHGAFSQSGHLDSVKALIDIGG